MIKLERKHYFPFINEVIGTDNDGEGLLKLFVERLVGLLQMEQYGTADQSWHHQRTTRHHVMMGYNKIQWDYIATGLSMKYSFTKLNLN